MDRPGERRHGLRTLLRANYAYAFLYEFMFAYAIYTAYFSLQGLSATTIGVLLAVWTASAVIFELPSGALADRYDRRLLLIAAPLIKAGCFILWAIADDRAWMFGLGFVLWSAGSALFSGTKEAVLFEHVHTGRFAHRYEKTVSRDRAFYESGIWSGVFFGGFIAYLDFELALWLSVLPLIGASVAAFWLKDMRASTADQQHGSRIHYLQHFRNAVKEFKGRPQLRYLTLYFALGITVIGIYDEFDQLFFLAVSLPIWAFGLVGAGLGVVRVLMAYYAYKFASIKHLSVIAPVIAGLLFLIAGSQAAVYMLVPLMGVYAVMAPIEVLGGAQFQKAMDGESRATTTSGLNISMDLFSVILVVVIGGAVDTVGVLPTYQFGGLYMLLFAAWAYWQSRKGMSV